MQNARMLEYTDKGCRLVASGTLDMYRPLWTTSHDMECNQFTNNPEACNASIVKRH